MKHSLKTGLSFGITSGIITTLGLMVGLHSGSRSKMVVMGGILTIAIADAFSDALGIHIAEESEHKHTHKEIWESTIYTFLSKFLCALSFIVAFFFLDLGTAIIVKIIWGLGLLAIFNFYLAKGQKSNPLHMVAEHLLIAIVVICATHFAGDLIHRFFNC